MTAATTSTAGTTDPTGPPALSTTAALTTFGTLAWVWLVWAVAGVLFVGILVAVRVWGELDESLWHPLGAGAQRWLFLVVGFTMVSEFGRMFIVNGVTRAQLARSALIAGAVVCPLGGAVAVAGYVVEGLAFDSFDWPHVLGAHDDARTAVDDAVDPLGSVGAVVRLYGEHVLTLAAFFVTGWLLGVAYRSLPRDEAHFFLLPSLLPAGTAVLLVRGDSFVFGFLDRLALDANPWLGASITAAVVVAGAAIAARTTRRIVL